MKSTSFILIIMLSLNIQSMNNPYIFTDLKQLEDLPRKPPVTGKTMVDEYKNINTKDDHRTTQIAPGFSVSKETTLIMCLSVIGSFIFVKLWKYKIHPDNKTMDRDDETIEIPKPQRTEDHTIDISKINIPFIDTPDQSDNESDE